MNKPIILVTPQNKAMEAPFLGQYNYSSTYNTSAIVSAGGIPVISPYLNEQDAETLMSRANGLLMTGGRIFCPSFMERRNWTPVEPQSPRGINQTLRCCGRR